MTPKHLERLRVTEITYRCRDIGYGVEEGIIEGFWTGEIDPWGKYTIRSTVGLPPMYLFADEIVEVADWRAAAVEA